MLEHKTLLAVHCQSIGELNLHRDEEVYVCKIQSKRAGMTRRG